MILPIADAGWQSIPAIIIQTSRIQTQDFIIIYSYSAVKIMT